MWALDRIVGEHVVENTVTLPIDGVARLQKRVAFDSVLRRHERRVQPVWPRGSVPARCWVSDRNQTY